MRVKSQTAIHAAIHPSVVTSTSATAYSKAPCLSCLEARPKTRDLIGRPGR